ncbi:Complement component [Nesidiocoris tenuis]|uniref:Complement component n=1 Tax=Nesidiocoris tenuis TaxID=355587 RepID=A0ABN7A9X2_9HEMI|nr:Complement component [Nesidiocoris tenuis]
MDVSAHAALAAALFTLCILVSSSEPPCHVVVAGRTIRPGQLYVVAIHLCTEEVIRFTTSILRSGVVLRSATLSIPSGGIVQIPLKVPAKAVAGDYKLVIEGSTPRGNFYFYNATSLVYQPKSVAIVVQTSRPIYRALQTVYFRILVLQMDLKAYDDSMDVFIVDSEGLVMRRWLSVFTNNGIASLSYKLPEYVKDGVWMIKVKIHNQIEEQKIRVENYFNPYFEVFVDLPNYFCPDVGVLNASVWGMLPTQEYVRGNLSLSLSLRYHDRSEWINLWKRNTFAANGPVNVELDLNKISVETEERVTGYDLKLKAAMTDFLFGSSSSGFAITRSTAGRKSHSTRIRFLCDGSRIPFKPSQPIVLSVAVEGSSGHALSPAKIENSKLSVVIEKTMVDGSSANEEPVEIYPVDFEQETSDLISVDPDALETFPDTGVITLTVRPPPKSSTLRISAVLDTPDGKYATSIFCVLAVSPSGNIALHASTLAPKIDEYAVFHLTADVPIESFMYLVISKDNIVLADDIARGSHIAATTTSFSVTMSPDMAPAFRIVAFAVYNGSIMSDSVFLPVSAFNRYEMELTMNNAKDLRGDSVEIIVSGDEGAYIAVNSGREQHSYRLQAGNDISLSRVTNALMSFEENFKRLPKVTRRSLDGNSAEETRYYPSTGYGKTPDETFSSNGLVVISNLMPAKNDRHDSPDSCVYPSQYTCNSGGCYSEEAKCNGVPDCLDSSDEQNCENAPEDDYDYLTSRLSRSMYLYDAADGDWAWREIKKNDHEGIEFDPVDVPEVADDWIINAFSVSTRLGFSVLESPVKYSSRRGLSAHLEGPGKCRRGEQLGLRLIVHNRDPTRSLVLVQLKGSPYFKSIAIAGDGIISSYSATLAGGDRHILIYVQGGRQERLDLPIVPTVEQGLVEIHVLASSQAGRAAMTHQLDVIPEGAIVKRHTSAVVNLQNRAHSITYLDIPIEETPVVPYQAWRRYIFGSPACTISFTGSLLGPLLDPEDVSIETTLDRQGKGTDVRLYEFGLNIWTLRYRRVTTTLQGGKEEQERLNRANLLYGNILKRFLSDGSFTNWDNAPPSVWLSAWVLRVFSQAVYADWEYVLYIDKTIFNRALDWIVNFQTPEGKFVETDYYLETPLDRHFGSDRVKPSDAGVALTAHVILALHNCDSHVEGTTKTRVVEAIQRGQKYLESRASSLLDPFTISIAVWALYNIGSSQFQSSMNSLKGKLRMNTDGLPYWSSVDIPAPEIKYENQRPFRRPRLYTSGDSKAVEATSYGLLSMLADDGITTTTDNIVLWLQTMRMSNGGFVSTMDSLLAAEALTVYAQYARLVDVTKMAVRITSPADSSVDHLMLIRNRTDISVSETIQMNKVWGHINVIGRGAGLALVQLQMSYGVDDRALVDKPAEKNFDLTIREFYSAARNKSLVTIEVCTRWIRDHPRASGSAVLEVDIPTGYRLVESEADQLIQNGVHPTLRAVKTFEQKTVWFFDKIPSDWHCFNHSVRRWFGVANMTLHRGALLYEANARESFIQVLFNSTPLYTLSICEVCGSYQCPYCPYYNSTIRQCNLSRIFLLEISILIFLLVLSKRRCYE